MYKENGFTRMINTINMQDMRYLNLFGKITGVNTRHCFKYNEFIFFSVPKEFVSKAIGENGKNVRKMSEILGRKIRVISAPESVLGARRFIAEIISPVTFKDFEIKGNEIIITAGMQSKAALLGRNKRRLYEMQKIASDFFGKELRII